MIAPKKLSKKEKKKLSKSLWESTQNIIDPKDIGELSEDDLSDEYEDIIENQ